jgi:hypothetical protein
MALAHGYALPFEALRRTGVLAQNTADATIRATADGATKEAAGSCLDARALEVQQRTVVQPSILVVPQLTRNGVVLNQLPDTRTNFIQNNTMVGATGSVRPNLWDLGTIPSGFTVSYSASGQTTAADGTLVDYIDVTVSGTALASGFLNLRQLPSTSPVSGNLLFAAGMTYTASVYLALLSGSLTGVATNVMALQEISNTTFVANTTFAPVTGITSALTRFTGTRPIDATGGADRVSVRWGHAIVSGTSYNYTVRIASPQLEKGSVATPVIRTASGFVTVDMLGVARDGAPPDFTFTRATTATRVNASGLIESVASGLLRLDYPIGGGCPAALIEPAATNLLLRSEEFDDASWVKVGTIVSGNVSLAPDNAMTADKLIVNNGVTFGNTDSFTRTGALTLAVGERYFVYIYAKPSGFGRMGVRTSTATNMSSGPELSIVIDLNTGLQTGGTIGDYLGRTPAANGYFRYVFLTRTIVSATNYLSFRPIDEVATQGNGVDGIEIWGAEIKLIQGSYIPTTSAAVTRNADVCSVSGVSGYIGQTEGTLYAEVDTRLTAGTSLKRIISINDGTTTNEIFLAKTSADALFSTVVSDSTAQASFQTSTNQSGIFKIALGYANNNVAMFVNGLQVGSTDTSALIPSLTNVDLGNRAGSIQFNDRIRAAAIYTTRLSNDQLANITRLT